MQAAAEEAVVREDMPKCRVAMAAAEKVTAAVEAAVGAGLAKVVGADLAGAVAAVAAVNWVAEAVGNSKRLLWTQAWKKSRRHRQTVSVSVLLSLALVLASALPTMGRRAVSSCPVLAAY